MLLVLNNSRWVPSYVHLGSGSEIRKERWPKVLQKSCNPAQTVATCFQHSHNLVISLTTQNVTYFMQVLLCEDRFWALRKLSDTKRQIIQSLELYKNYGPNLKLYPQKSIHQNILFQIFQPNLKHLHTMEEKKCTNSIFSSSRVSEPEIKAILHMLLPIIRFDAKKLSSGSCDAHSIKNYLADANQYNFITCNFVSPTLSFKMYIEFFDTKVWICLLFSMGGMIIMIGLVLRFMESLKYSRTMPVVGLVLFGSLLNVSLDYGLILELGKFTTRRFIHNFWDLVPFGGNHQ